MDINQVFGGNSLKVEDLKDREHNVVIESVTEKKFEEGGSKLIISFQHRTKTLVCNKTNAKAIAYMYGTNTDMWIGKEIQLFPAVVDFKGTLTPAIRVRPAPSRGFSGGWQVTPAQAPAQHAPASAETAVDNDEIPF